MYDKQLIAERFTKSTYSYEQSASVQKWCIEQLLTRLQNQPNNLINRPHSALEIGCGTGLATQAINTLMNIDELWLNDVSETMLQHATKSVTTSLGATKIHSLMGDIESIALPENLSLIYSTSVFQWMENPQRLLKRLYQSLKPNGLLASTTYTSGHFQEINQLMGVSLHYYGVDEWQTMLKRAGFNIQSQLFKQKIMLFDSPLSVLKHLKQTGVTGTAKRMWTKRELNRFCQQYEQHFSHNSQVTLTYQPYLWIASK